MNKKFVLQAARQFLKAFKYVTLTTRSSDDLNPYCYVHTIGNHCATYEHFWPKKREDLYKCDLDPNFKFKWLPVFIGKWIKEAILICNHCDKYVHPQTKFIISRLTFCLKSVSKSWVKSFMYDCSILVYWDFN